MVKKKTFSIILILIFIQICQLEGKKKIKKHFLNAKLAYINSEYEIAEKELLISLEKREVSYNEIEQFFELLKYIKNFCIREFKKAEKHYNSKKYRKCINILSGILKKNSNHKPSLELYKKAYKKLSQKEKEKLINHLRKREKEHLSKGEEIYLIPVYTELLLIDSKNKKIELALAKLKLKYKSRKMQEEIRRMINLIKAEIKKEKFDVNKIEEIVEDLLYLAPHNKDVKEIAEILKKYKDKTKLKEEISAKADEILLKKPKKKEQKKIIERIKQVVKEPKKERIIKAQNKQIANYHFNLGINRYKKKRYIEAKEEFIYAKVIDPELVEADRYIKKCEEKIKIKEAKLKKDIKKAIKEAEVLIKNKKVEKAVKHFYERVIKTDINNKEAEKYLNMILRKKIRWDKIEINKYSNFYYIFNLLNKIGRYYYKKGEYVKSLMLWENILSVYPENKTVLKNWNKSFASLKNKDKYIKRLYDKGIRYFNNGQYKTSLLYFNLILKHKKRYKNVEKLKNKCLSYLSKEKRDESRIEEIYNSALLDFINEDYYMAMNKLEYILKLAPGNIRARYYLNKTLNILNRKGLQEEIKISKDDLKKINAFYYKGIIEYIKGNYERALLYWKEVLKIYPEHLKAIYNINKVTLTLKQKQ